MRNPNTTILNESFGSNAVSAVWVKAPIVPGYDSAKYRKDKCGAWMEFGAYGNTASDYGWEIDHDKPVAKGGTDDLSNLQPLHWKNNRGKSDNWPQWTCSISASK